MKLLLDTNIILEVLLAQTNAPAAMQLLTNEDEHYLVLSDYALHSIATLLIRKRQAAQLEDFLAEMIDSGRITVTGVRTGELALVSRLATQLGLDFDDAYQYRIADKAGLVLVSFDGHFDRTPMGRKTPQDILNSSNQ